MGLLLVVLALLDASQLLFAGEMVNRFVDSSDATVMGQEVVSMAGVGRSLQLMGRDEEALAVLRK